MTPQSEVAPDVFPLVLALAMIVSIPITCVFLRLFACLLAFIGKHTDWLDYDDVGPC